MKMINRKRDRASSLQNPFLESSRIADMIDPNAINPLLLPSVALGNRSCLPNTPCIYFAIDSLGQIQYIGRSINPCQRWNGHHRYNELSEMRGVKIAYFSVDSAELLPSIESALIQWFDPPLNVRGRSHQTQRKFDPVKYSKETSETPAPKMTRIDFSVPALLHDDAKAIAAAEGWKESDLYRIFWERGFADYAEDSNKRLAKKSPFLSQSREGF